MEQSMLSSRSVFETSQANILNLVGTHQIPQAG